MILLLATRNQGKIKEIKEILSDLSFEIKSLADVNYKAKVKETGKTFEENAILKAKAIGEKTGLLTLAEDSGLEIDALRGRPGIRSARYKSGTDLDRINKVLKELEGVPKEKRNARFRAVVAVYVTFSSHSGERSDSIIPNNIIDTRQARMMGRNRVVTFEGVSDGYITEKPIGRNGFGYDPIFFNLDLGKTNAQATLKEKNRVSHRARALKKAKQFLLKIF